MATASQMEAMAGCARIYAWDLVSPEPYVQSSQAGLGDEIHEVGELYQKRGTAPDENTLEGRCFMPALPYVPKPMTCTAEGEFKWVFQGQFFSGTEDLWGDAQDLPQKIYPCPPGTPFILDLKSSNKAGDRRRRLEGAGAFLTNVQCLTYAMRRMVLLGAHQIYVRWLYLRTPDEEGKGKPKAYPEDALLSFPEVQEAFYRLVLPLARGVNYFRENRTRLDVLALRPNPNRCMKYGKKYPCRHLAKCGDLSSWISTDTIMEDSYMSNPETDILALMQQATNGVPTVVSGAAPAVLAAPSAPVNMNPFAPPAAAAPASPVVTMPAPSVISVAPPAPAPAQAPQAGFVNPPEAAVRAAQEKAEQFGTPAGPYFDMRKEMATPFAIAGTPADAKLEAAAQGDKRAQHDLGLEPAPAAISDAELGRAIRVLFAFLRSL